MTTISVLGEIEFPGTQAGGADATRKKSRHFSVKRGSWPGRTGKIILKNDLRWGNSTSTASHAPPVRRQFHELIFVRNTPRAIRSNIIQYVPLNDRNILFHPWGER